MQGKCQFKSSGRLDRWIWLLFGLTAGIGLQALDIHWGEAIYSLRTKIYNGEKFRLGGVMTANTTAFNLPASRLGKALDLQGPFPSPSPPDMGVWFAATAQARSNYRPHYCVYATNAIVFIIATDATEADRAVDALLAALGNPAKAQGGRLLNPLVLSDVKRE